MKKISLIVLVLLMTVILSCSKKENKITIAATATPHAEILEFLKPKLKEKGFDLEIMVVSDVVIGNNALKEGNIILMLYGLGVYAQVQKDITLKVLERHDAREILEATGKYPYYSHSETLFYRDK